MTRPWLGRVRPSPALAVALALVASAAMAAPAAAHTALFSVAVGYNGAPVSAGKDLASLHFADDDAVSFHRFARTLARRSYLLTVPDPETLRRSPGVADEARPPSRAELAHVIAELKGELAKAAAAGDDTAVLIFYSGHGTRDAAGASALTLLDGPLNQAALYDDVLAPLPAGFVHLFVDACHAEAVVRPRDLQAKVVEPSAVDLGDYLSQTTLARFPNVGAVVASTAGAQAHEWDTYQAGIFTHEVLSALRGAADIDGNRRIEYSELGAFLAAANREVTDPRARPRTVIRPPPLNPRIAIVDTAELRDSALIEGRPGSLGAFYVEDGRGNRLIDMRAEPRFRVTLVVPARETLYLRNARGEAVLQPEVGARVRFEGIHLQPSDVRARGALETSLRRGLFATRFGPDYYRGFADRRDDLVPVELNEPEIIVDAEEDTQTAAATAGASGGRRKGTAAWVALGASAGLAVTSGIFAALSLKARSDFQNTELERPAMDAENRYQRNLAISLTALVTSALVGGLSAYLFTRDNP